MKRTMFNLFAATFRFPYYRFSLLVVYSLDASHELLIICPCHWGYCSIAVQHLTGFNLTHAINQGFVCVQYVFATDYDYCPYQNALCASRISRREERCDSVSPHSQRAAEVRLLAPPSMNRWIKQEFKTSRCKLKIKWSI